METRSISCRSAMGSLLPRTILPPSTLLLSVPRKDTARRGSVTDFCKPNKFKHCDPHTAAPPVTDATATIKLRRRSASYLSAAATEASISSFSLIACCSSSSITGVFSGCRSPFCDETPLQGRRGGTKEAGLLQAPTGMAKMRERNVVEVIVGIDPRDVIYYTLYCT